MSFRLLVLAIFLLYANVSFATHQRAGEISYTYVSGLTYEFTITTYTYTPSPADRPEIEVSWGDGSFSTIDRFQKVDLGNDISKNIYISQHTFSAVGTFHVTFEDPNRNAGIINIPGSVEIPFFIETIVVINPFIGGNSSPQLLNPPIDNGCTNVTYYHNLGAFDTDGDSLSFSLINCRGYEGEDIPGYSFPNASNAITIDPVTGDLIWDSPTMAGEYNIAILIQEWRQGVMISSMVRDMQITIAPCNNQPPEIVSYDTCVLAGTHLILPISVQDPTSTQVMLSATGEPLYAEIDPAHFMPITQDVPYTTHFVWYTQCEHVKKEPYSVLLKAQDNGPQVELVSFKTIHIKVIAPAPKNLQAQPSGNSVVLSWQPDSCFNAIGYDVYRKNGSADREPDYCETGMPNGWGYEKIGTTYAWEDTVFVDDGSTLDLFHANEYCYRVVALFADGAESYVSEEVCVHIANDAPLMVNADVLTTDSLFGTLLVRWIMPPELDSIAFPPPYECGLYAKNIEDTNFTLLTTTPAVSDTMSFIDHDRNTRDGQFVYYIELQNEDTVLECSDLAPSIFLNVQSGDRKLVLSWQDHQPWRNVQYKVYRFNTSINQWDTIARTSNTTFIDVGLDNRENYCYYVEAEGYYWIPDTIGPLYNRSQQVCASPYDNIPPEQPRVSVISDCSTVNYSWTFSSDSAAADAYAYYFYYKPTLLSDFICVDSLIGYDDDCYSSPCEYQLSGMDVVVGCFAMSVADLNHNVSILSDTSCMDVYGCLDYRFPNVFTPNDDGINDFFVPFDPYQGVTKVFMQIYDRWGRRVFSTEDPAVLWDGMDENTHKPCSEGVYYYGCDVFVNTLTGQFSFPLNGSVTLIR